MTAIFIRSSFRLKKRLKIDRELHKKIKNVGSCASPPIYEFHAAVLAFAVKALRPHPLSRDAASSARKVGPPFRARRRRGESRLAGLRSRTFHRVFQAFGQRQRIPIRT